MLSKMHQALRGSSRGSNVLIWSLTGLSDDGGGLRSALQRDRMTCTNHTCTRAYLDFTTMTCQHRKTGHRLTEFVRWCLQRHRDCRSSQWLVCTVNWSAPTHSPWIHVSLTHQESGWGFSEREKITNNSACTVDFQRPNTLAVSAAQAWATSEKYGDYAIQVLEVLVFRPRVSFT